MGIMIGPQVQSDNLVAHHWEGIIVIAGSHSNVIPQNDARGNGLAGWTDLRDANIINSTVLGLFVAVLPAWYDVDTATDLQRLRVEVASLSPDTLCSTRRFLAGCPPAP